MTTARTFLAIMERDLRVLSRNLGDFFLRIGVQPLLFAFIFGYVLPTIGTIPREFASLVLPGILGVSTLTAGVQGTAIPLAWDFGATKEIQDRLMAPISVRLVMLEKIVMGMVEAWLAAAFVFPVAYLIMRANLELQVTSYPLLILILFLAGLASATLGMVLGTVVEPMRFATMFATVVIPMIFLGATYYPWAGLSAIPWLQYLVLVNPLVYVSEAYRGVLTPQIPHMATGYALLGISVSIVVLMAMAVKEFEKRALS
jgi:ABC-2 type transport system permease protein